MTWCPSPRPTGNSPLRLLGHLWMNLESRKFRCMQTTETTDVSLLFSFLAFSKLNSSWHFPLLLFSLSAVFTYSVFFADCRLCCHCSVIFLFLFSFLSLFFPFFFFPPVFSFSPPFIPIARPPALQGFAASQAVTFALSLSLSLSPSPDWASPSAVSK